MKNIKRYKRGFAIEYAIAVIAIVALFGALIYLNTLYSTSGTDAYAEYIERKAFLDKIGDLSIEKYDGQPTAKNINITTYSGNNDYGYVITEDTTNGAVMVITVKQGENAVLTVTFVINTDKYQLISYIYGDIYYV